jgi:predicted CoA-binding protein
MDAKELLQQVRTILVIDWPSQDVPETLTRAGFRVFVKGGPGPEDYSAYELNSGKIVPRHTGRYPEHADLVYMYRPFAELAQNIDVAKATGAKILWTQSGVSPDGSDDPKGCWVPADEFKSAQQQVEAAGLQLITQPYIADLAREISGSPKAAM